MAKKLFPIIITALLFIIIYLLGRTVPQEEILSFIKSIGAFGPILLILLLLLTDIIAPLSSTPLYFAGFYAFGSKVVFYSVIAGFIASISNFWIARLWGRKLVEKFAGKVNMGKIDKLTQEYGLVTLLILRILKAGIGDFVSYAAGLTSMKFRSYILVSIIGMIPGSIVWYFLSLKAKNPLEFTFLTILLIIISVILFFMASFFIKKLKKQ